MQKFFSFIIRATVILVIVYVFIVFFEHGTEGFWQGLTTEWKNLLVFFSDFVKKFSA